MHDRIWQILPKYAEKQSFLPRLSLLTASVMLIKLVVSFLEKPKEKRQ
jgi:hypothetical protein